VIPVLIVAMSGHATTLLFGGDIMLNGIQPSKDEFAGIASLTASSDLSFGNLEIPLTDSRTPTSRKSAAEVKARNQWILKANPAHAGFLFQSGIGAVSLANNHAMDYGSTGLRQMTGLLDQFKIAHAGAGQTTDEALTAAVITAKTGKKIALLSAMGFVTAKAHWKVTPATDQTAGVAVLDLAGRIDDRAKQRLSDWITAAHKSADLVVVGVHWGVERKPLPTPYQVNLGRALIDAGADIVWGNHPHVLQGAEMYHGKLIMYSMGNLISSLPAQNGFFQVSIGDDGQQAASFVPATVHGGKVSVLDGAKGKAATKTMHELCKLLLRKYPAPVSIAAL